MVLNNAGFVNEGVTGTPTGTVQDFVFIKHIHRKNILWHPVPSLTISKPLYDSDRRYFNKVRLIMDSGDVYELSAEAFDRVRVSYNYGNGDNYRVPLCEWNKTAHQLTFKGVE